jgi:hypothetical protein
MRERSRRASPDHRDRAAGQVTQRRTPGGAIALAAAVLALVCLGLAATTAVAQGTPAANVTLMIVLDNSGSMDTNDREGLRFPAAQMVVKLLDPGDRVGYVFFDSDARGSSQLTQIRSEDDKVGVMASLDDAAGRSDRNSTNMRAAFEQAAKVLAGDTSGNKRYLIFLTDGEPVAPGIGQASPAFRQWWAETLQFVGDTKAEVLAIGLTQASQTDYLKQVVERSNGKSFSANRNGELAAAFLEAFAHLRHRTVVEPLPRPSQSEACFPRFGPWYKRAYFVAVGGQAPRGQVSVSGGAPADLSTPWSRGRFSVFTHAPATGVDLPPGDWCLKLSSDADLVRAILISRFELQIITPKSGARAAFEKPLLVRASLLERLDDGTVRRLEPRSFGVTLDIPGRSGQWPQLKDEGRDGDEAAYDLVYGTLISGFDQPGTYRIQVAAYATHDGKDVPILSDSSVTLEPFPTLAVESPANQVYRLRGGGTLPLSARTVLAGRATTVPDATVTALVTKPDGAKVEIPLQPAGELYRAEYAPDQDGEHTIAFELSATYKETPAADNRSVNPTVALVPRLEVASTRLDFGTVTDLRKGAAAELAVRSFAGRAVRLSVSVPEWPDVVLAAAPATLPPRSSGPATIRLTSDRDLPPGERSGMLVIASDADVEIEPASIPVTFRIPAPPPWWQTYVPWAAGVLAGLVGLILLWGRIQGPPGILEGTQAPAGALAPTVVLAAKRGLWPRDRVSVGSAGRNNIVLPDPSVAPRQASIQGRRERLIEPGRTSTRWWSVVRNVGPDDSVAVNGTPLMGGDERELRSDDTVTIGDYRFTYVDPAATADDAADSGWGATGDEPDYTDAAG